MTTPVKLCDALPSWYLLIRGSVEEVDLLKIHIGDHLCMYNNILIIVIVTILMLMPCTVIVKFVVKQCDWCK